MSAPSGAVTVIKSPAQYELSVTPVTRVGSKLALTLTETIFDVKFPHESGSLKIPSPFES